MVGVDVVGVDLIHAFLLEGDLAVDGIVADFEDVVGGELRSLVLAVELHLVAVPGISVGADEVVAVVCVGVAEIEIEALDGVQVCHSHADPGGKLLHLHLPPLYASGH